MIAKIIISANEDENRMGLLENGILMEYLVERKEEFFPIMPVAAFIYCFIF